MVNLFAHTEDLLTKKVAIFAQLSRKCLPRTKLAIAINALVTAQLQKSVFL